LKKSGQIKISLGHPFEEYEVGQPKDKTSEEASQSIEKWNLRLD